MVNPAFRHNFYIFSYNEQLEKFKEISSTSFYCMIPPQKAATLKKPGFHLVNIQALLTGGIMGKEVSFSTFL